MKKSDNSNQQLKTTTMEQVSLCLPWDPVVQAYFENWYGQCDLITSSPRASTVVDDVLLQSIRKGDTTAVFLLLTQYHNWYRDGFTSKAQWNNLVNGKKKTEERTATGRCCNDIRSSATKSSEELKHSTLEMNTTPYTERKNRGNSSTTRRQTSHGHAKTRKTCSSKTIRCSYTPFQWAVYYSREEIVALLLDWKQAYGINVEMPDDCSLMSGAFYRAVEKNSKRILSLLINNSDWSAEVINKQDSRGRTLLHCAVMNLNEVIVELLLKHKDVDMHLRDIIQKKTPYEHALARGNLNIIQMLQDRSTKT